MTATRDDHGTPQASDAANHEINPAGAIAAPLQPAESSVRKTRATTTGSAGAAARPTARAVERYLRDHPDFFVKHLPLLDILSIPHPVRGAVSLLETQIRFLREKNRYLNGQIETLYRNASANQEVVAQLHRLALTLVRQPSTRATIETVRTFLIRELRAQCVHVLLRDAPNDSRAWRSDTDWAELAPVLNAGQVLCGRHRKSRLRAAFGPDNNDEIRSAILSPLRIMAREPGETSQAGDGAQQTLGLLAIGSSDPARYQADMGTFLLSHLTELLTAALSAGQAASEPCSQGFPPAVASS